MKCKDYISCKPCSLISSNKKHWEFNARECFSCKVLKTWPTAESCPAGSDITVTSLWHHWPLPLPRSYSRPDQLQRLRQTGMCCQRHMQPDRKQHLPGTSLQLQLHLLHHRPVQRGVDRPPVAGCRHQRRPAGQRVAVLDAEVRSPTACLQARLHLSVQ